MQGRLVYCDTDWQTVSAVQDLLEIKLGTAQAGFVTGWKIMQSSLEGTSSVVKDKISLKRATGSFTSGSGGGSATIILGSSIDPAHGLATVERNNTTQAVVGTGTLNVIDADAFNESSGVLDVQYIPEEWKPIGPSEAAILSLDEAPSASGTFRAFMRILLTHG